MEQRPNLHPLEEESGDSKGKENAQGQGTAYIRNHVS